MKKIGLLVLGLATVSVAFPAAAETVTVKRGHHGDHGARAQMRGYHGGDMHRGMRMHGNRTVVIKRGHGRHRY